MACVAVYLCGDLGRSRQVGVAHAVCPPCLRPTSCTQHILCTGVVKEGGAVVLRGALRPLLLAVAWGRAYTYSCTWGLRSTPLRGPAYRLGHCAAPEQRFDYLGQVPRSLRLLSRSQEQLQSAAVFQVCRLSSGRRTGRIRDVLPGSLTFTGSSSAHSSSGICITRLSLPPMQA
jgi:hypothetical protein